MLGNKTYNNIKLWIHSKIQQQKIFQTQINTCASRTKNYLLTVCPAPKQSLETSLQVIILKFKTI